MPGGALRDGSTKEKEKRYVVFTLLIKTEHVEDSEKSPPFSFLFNNVLKFLFLKHLCFIHFF